MKKNVIVLLLICNIVVTLGIGAFVYSKFSYTPTKNDHIADFYAIENAVHVSPHGLRKSMDKGELSYTIVDLRSKQEYEKEHIIGAVNIPAYSDPDTSAYNDVERIVSSFQKLPQDKDTVVYCYSTPCMTGRKIGLMLAEKGIFVKHLGIGWNEWRHHWNLWNHEHEWETTLVEEYVQSGSEPGVPKKKKVDPFVPCSIDDQFGC